MKIEEISINEIKEYENNAKLHPPEQIEQIVKSIEQFGFNDPIAIDESNVIIEGHGRLLALQKMGQTKVPIIRLSHLSEDQKKAYILAHNQLTLNTGFDEELLRLELESIVSVDMGDFGFELNLDEFEEELKEPSQKEKDESVSLIDTFLAPPFSVLDARQGYWQDRKKQWKSLGIRSEVGRDNATVIGSFSSDKYNIKTANEPYVSIFDPALCEVMYKWFNVDNGKIYDPFAGGSVRGVVAKKLGYEYTGIDIRQEQIEANFNNANEMGLSDIIWICDDSKNVDKYIKNNSVDMIFSCPPYADLEVYSDLEGDISNKEYNEFIKMYAVIIEKAITKLKNNRFAVFVVGDVRDKDGFYYDFLSDTKKIFIENNVRLYNEITYLQGQGTAALRANKQFLTSRKTVKVNDTVLVFYKGDPKKIKNYYKEIEIAEITESEVQEN